MRQAPISISISFILSLVSLTICQAATVETFVTPDSGFDALSRFISNSNSSIVIATYTFTSPEILSMLLGRGAEGVSISVLVEKSPAGGRPEGEDGILCALARRNASVMLYDGPLRYMHAKYMVSDGKAALVTSENLGRSGFSPGADYGNRGWGAIIRDSAIPGMLARVFSEDRGHATDIACKPGESFKANDAARRGAYSGRFSTGFFRDQDVALVTSPDSLEPLLALIGSANESVLVQQLYVYSHWGSPKYDTVASAPSPLLDALIAKARQGVDVRILLDSSDFNMENDSSVSNLQTIAHVNGIAASEGIPIVAKAIDLRGLGLAEAHNKGIVVDGKAALVSSINWNENSVRSNREAGLIIIGEAAGYYEKAFMSDWGGAPVMNAGDVQGFGPVPAALSALALAVIFILIYLGSRRDKHPVDL